MHFDWYGKWGSGTTLLFCNHARKQIEHLCTIQRVSWMSGYWAVRPFYLKPSKVPAKRSMAVKPRGPGHGIRTQIVPLNWRVPHEMITEIMQKHQNNPRDFRGVWSRSTREFHRIPAHPGLWPYFAITPGKYPRNPKKNGHQWCQNPGLGASDLLEGHFQGLDEVPGILMSWPKVEIKKKPLKKHTKYWEVSIKRLGFREKVGIQVSKIYVPTTKFPFSTPFGPKNRCNFSHPLHQTPGETLGAVLNAAADANEAVCDADLTPVLNVCPSKALVENYAE